MEFFSEVKNKLQITPNFFSLPFMHLSFVNFSKVSFGSNK